MHVLKILQGAQELPPLLRALDPTAAGAESRVAGERARSRTAWAAIAWLAVWASFDLSGREITGRCAP
jgi:hypothetical protein